MLNLNQMTSKTRILNALTGKETDRVPWSPFFAYYWDFLDEKTRGEGMVRYYQDMGADPLLRGTVSLQEVRWDHCEIREQREGGLRRSSYETPVGSLTEDYSYSSAANSWFLTKHPVQSSEDFKTLIYLYEHVQVTPSLKAFRQQYDSLGEAGLILPVIGVGSKTAFQSLVEHWCGTEHLAYALCDFPDLVEECLQLMWEKDEETIDIALCSPAEGFIFWEDSSTTNISPDFFRRYTLPQINRWGERLHRENRLLVHHACGHLRDFMPLMAESAIDALESVSPPPTGNIEPWEIRRALPPRIALIGGIEPTFLLQSGTKELLTQVELLLQRMKGSRYILANSDSCPPGVEYEKFLAVSRLVAEGC